MERIWVNQSTSIATEICLILQIKFDDNPLRGFIKPFE